MPGSFLFGACPNAGGDNAGNAALCPHGVAKVIAAVGAIGKHLAGIIGSASGACLTVIDISGCDRDFLDQRRIGIGADMGLEAVNSPLSFVLYPARIVIALTGGRQ